MPTVEVFTESIPKPNVLWTARNIQLYNNSTNNAPMSIHIPECCASCIGMCSGSMHREPLNAFSCDISRALSELVDCCETVGLCIRYSGLIICRN